MGEPGSATAGGSAAATARLTGARGIARLLKSAATVVTGTSDVDEAMRWALTLVCDYTGWPIGHIFAVDATTGLLTSTEIWHNDDPIRFEPFVSATVAAPLEWGEGLPGRILASGEPAWIMDVRADDNFPRAALATECGIGAGFGFPIASSRGIEAVMEFFAPEAIEPDEMLLDLLSHVGLHLGGLLDRSREEGHRRRAQDDLASQQRVLEKIARGEPLVSTLDTLCRDIECHYPEARCTVLLVDRAKQVLRHIAAPSLPSGFQLAIDGLAVAVGAGACGTAAARGQLVVVSDTLVDPLTAGFVDLAVEYDLRSVWSHPLTDAAGTVLGTFAVYRAVPHSPDPTEVDAVRAAASLAALAIERSLAERALAAAAQVDPLTRLPNRSRFLELVTRCLDDPANAIAVMVLDLDGFKWVNDSLGHPAGDRLLVEVAGRLRAALDDDHVISRFGGDEFTVLVADTTPERIVAAADHIESTFVDPFWLDGGEFFLSVSVGIACNEPGSEASGLVRDADAAMYAAKESGRAQRAMFDEGLRERAVARLTLESDLRRAIERDEFVMHYQPILELRSNRWVGVESLVRWEHPSRGLLAPDQFIPLAEDTGLIVPLGMRILERVIGEAAELTERCPTIGVGVNLSVVQLSDPLLALQIDGLLTRHDLSADRLVLEVTETAVMQELDTARAALDQIVALGVKLFIDDFGTGFSSIARLGELPVVGIKIDRRFTTQLTIDPTMERVVAAIAELAHALDLLVVAEGVETPTARRTVQELGCDAGQGYGIARPMPLEQAVMLLGQTPDGPPGAPSS